MKIKLGQIWKLKVEYFANREAIIGIVYSGPSQGRWHLTDNLETKHRVTFLSEEEIFTRYTYEGELEQVQIPAVRWQDKVYCADFAYFTPTLRLVSERPECEITNF